MIAGYSLIFIEPENKNVISDQYGSELKTQGCKFLYAQCFCPPVK